METFKVFKDLFSKLDSTKHKDLAEDYGINITIREHMDSIMKYISDSSSLLMRRFDYAQNDIGTVIDKNKEIIDLAIILHDINQLEGMDKDFFVDNREEKEIKIKDVIKKYLEDEFETLNPLAMKIVFNKELDINDEEKVIELATNSDDKFIWTFSMFLIAHAYGVASTIKQFNDVGINLNNKEKFHSPNFTLIDLFVKKRFEKYFQTLETIFGNKAKTDGKEFTDKIILVNKVFEKEINKMDEEMGMSDIGGGDAATRLEWGTSGNSVSALSSNLLGQPIRRAFPWKIQGGKMKKMKRKGKRIINPTNFNVSIGF